MAFETIFTMEASNIKFGPGVTREVGYDMKDLGAHRVMVVIDPKLKDSEAGSIVLEALRQEEIDIAVFDQVRIEPNDGSFKAAIRFASEGQFDGYVAIGGGSTMDTAKVANLYATYPADFMDYVNLPIGKGKPVPGPLRPMIAIPTTAGTGSETTGTAVFDFAERHVKTGIAHRYLRPHKGLIDPNNTRTLPRMVAACTGLDVICHALESLTAIPYHQRQAPENPSMRPAYQGANPISHVWAVQAIELVARYLIRAVADPSDDEARGQMILASTFAGIGFGNAGVSLPHAMSYPIAGMVRSYHPESYPEDHPMIPHGMAVILTSAAAFRFMGPSNPEMHLRAAQLMGADTQRLAPEEAGEALARRMIDLIRKTGMPNGLNAVGYTPEDIDRLVEGTLAQQRLTRLSPRPATADDFRKLFLDSMTIW